MSQPPAVDAATGPPAIHPVAALLDRAGPFAAQLPGFMPRQSQMAMAALVADTLEARDIAVIEAGTGTGKTFAYLLPAVISGKRVIISTGTKNLQQQLFFRDLPALLRVLGLDLSSALLKGRGNYLCPHRLGLTLESVTLFEREDRQLLGELAQWHSGGGSGDLGDFPALDEAHPLWPRITSSADNCLGQECPDFSRCPLMEARREALKAELVVINHHLLFADMVLKEEGVGELLPGAHALIIDEAHLLPEIAGQFFGERLSSRQLIELARDSEGAALKEAADDLPLRQLAAGLEQAARRLRRTLGPSEQRAPWNRLLDRAEFSAQADQLHEMLEQLRQRLELVQGRGRELALCCERAGRLSTILATLLSEQAQESVRWYETSEQGFAFNRTPLSVAEPFRQALTGYRAAWIFTSATLAVGQKFDHFIAQLGLDRLPRPPRGCVLPSPFDYSRQALLYLPAQMPEPNQPDFTHCWIERLLPLLRASRGGAFLLFTSHRALREAATLLRQQIDLPLLVQGELSRRAMLERFIERDDALLLGASSFWQGVDIPGQSLRLVAIDKLPFASPDDPVTQARVDAMRRQGGNPFNDYQLPQAVVSLKQGVGRLIRGVTDRGVLVIGDPRLRSRSYGRIFRQSLPPMPLTDREAQAVDFLEALCPSTSVTDSELPDHGQTACP